ncbi:MAG: hypothetical protein Q7U76_12975 [Nitrospirota bacterium]|nr:hypothetical protein [Nitrospirota bacterium]
MGELTTQEKLFFDRVALKMTSASNITVEAIQEAAQKVLNDDVKIVNRFVHLRPDERHALGKGLSGIVYDAIRGKKEATR